MYILLRTMALIFILCAPVMYMFYIACFIEDALKISRVSIDLEKGVLIRIFKKCLKDRYLLFWSLSSNNNESFSARILKHTREELSAIKFGNITDAFYWIVSNGERNSSILISAKSKMRADCLRRDLFKDLNSFKNIRVDSADSMELNHKVKLSIYDYIVIYEDEKKVIIYKKNAQNIFIL